MNPEQIQAVRSYVAACDDPAASLGATYGNMRRALQGWPAVARLVVEQHEEIERLRGVLATIKRRRQTK